MLCLLDPRGGSLGWWPCPLWPGKWPHPFGSHNVALYLEWRRQSQSPNVNDRPTSLWTSFEVILPFSWRITHVDSWIAPFTCFLPIQPRSLKAFLLLVSSHLYLLQSELEVFLLSRLIKFTSCRPSLFGKQLCGYTLGVRFRAHSLILCNMEWLTISMSSYSG